MFSAVLIPMLALVVSSDAALLFISALVVGLLAAVVLRMTAHAFGIRLRHEPRLDRESVEIPAAVRESERRIMELLERVLPEHTTRYVRQRSEAKESDTAETVRMALEVAPEEAAPEIEVALVLAELQAQVQQSNAAVQVLEHSMQSNYDQIELLGSTAITPERVTVIASGMAVGLVLLLCTFGSLLVAALNVASSQGSPAVKQAQAQSTGTSTRVQSPARRTADAPQSTPTAPSGYCLTQVSDGILIRPRSSDGRC